MTLGQLIERVLACLQPHDFSVDVHANFACKLLERIRSLDLKAYSLGQKSHEDLGMGGFVIHQVFHRILDCGSPRSTLKCCWKEDDEEEE